MAVGTTKDGMSEAATAPGPAPERPRLSMPPSAAGLIGAALGYLAALGPVLASARTPHRGRGIGPRRVLRVRPRAVVSALARMAGWRPGRTARRAGWTAAGALWLVGGGADPAVARRHRRPSRSPRHAATGRSTRSWRSGRAWPCSRPSSWSAGCCGRWAANSTGPRRWFVPTGRWSMAVGGVAAFAVCAALAGMALEGTRTVYQALDASQDGQSPPDAGHAQRRPLLHGRLGRPGLPGTRVRDRRAHRGAARGLRRRAGRRARAGVRRTGPRPIRRRSGRERGGRAGPARRLRPRQPRPRDPHRHRVDRRARHRRRRAAPRRRRGNGGDPVLLPAVLVLLHRRPPLGRGVERGGHRRGARRRRGAAAGAAAQGLAVWRVARRVRRPRRPGWPISRGGRPTREHRRRGVGRLPVHRLAVGRLAREPGRWADLAARHRPGRRGAGLHRGRGAHRSARPLAGPADRPGGPPQRPRGVVERLAGGAAGRVAARPPRARCRPLAALVADRDLLACRPRPGGGGDHAPGSGHLYPESTADAMGAVLTADSWNAEVARRLNAALDELGVEDTPWAR